MGVIYSIKNTLHSYFNTLKNTSKSAKQSASHTFNWKLKRKQDSEQQCSIDTEIKLRKSVDKVTAAKQKSRKILPFSFIAFKIRYTHPHFCRNLQDDARFGYSDCRSEVASVCLCSAFCHCNTKPPHLCFRSMFSIHL